MDEVTRGESGAAVYRSSDGTWYLKRVPAGQEASLRAERDRVEWLGAQGVPCPRVLDWREGPEGAELTTSAVAGVPADRVPAATLLASWAAIADAVRRLHELPPQTCPFTRDLTTMYALALDVVARGAVNPEFLPDEQQATPPAALLARLTPQLDARLAQEAAQTVVCHGDLCLPNILLDPESATVTGFIDLGRLGRADPYADIALLLANSRETWAGEDAAREADDAFAARYGTPLDHDRARFYLGLDPLTWG
ncbi:APH(3'') family aminoglycoside O-phosphotransferase [Streptomyces sp. NPDC049881]|uniref:APH(3'') family aminoglycoside O-phosphotransferase n=1 Tax=Streptomyces sp. NPDC049881 TaxID=3155778 RepID=UPI00341610D2